MANYVAPWYDPLPSGMVVEITYLPDGTPVFSTPGLAPSKDLDKLVRLYKVLFGASTPPPVFAPADDIITRDELTAALSGVSSQPPLTPKKTEFLGPERWITANRSVSSAPGLAASVTGGGSSVTAVIVKVGDMSGGGSNFRLSFDWSKTADTGANYLQNLEYGLTDFNGGLKSGFAWQTAVSKGEARTSGKWVIDINPSGGDVEQYLTIRINGVAVPAGTSMAFSNVSVRLIPRISYRLYAGAWYEGYGTGNMRIYARRVNPLTGKLQAVSMAYMGDGTLTESMGESVGFSGPDPQGIGGFDNSGPTWDPAMRRASKNGTNGQRELSQYGGDPDFKSGSLHVNNNDQIFAYRLPDNSVELSGNTHGNEVNDGAAVFTADYGSGTFAAFDAKTSMASVDRLHVSWPTKLKRSVDTDYSNPFATVTHESTVFKDGMERHDRTTSFLRTLTLTSHIEWMTSHNIYVPYLGRTGVGANVLTRTDTNTYATVPAVPTTTNNTTGSLVAGTYTYRVSAITDNGETTLSAPVSVTTSATGSVTVTATGSTGATGYKFYGRVAGRERHLATVPADSNNTAVFVDDGTKVPSGKQPTTNTAAITVGLNTAVPSMKGSGEASWAVKYEAQTGWCFGTIVDREACLSRDGVVGVTVNEGAASGIQKIYNALVFANGELTVNSGVTWTATHWHYRYLPADPTQFHAEIAALAALPSSTLKSLYPAT